MRRTDPKNKQGKFIKSNSQLEKVVRITSYSFEEISEAVLSDTDNANHNVIHRRFHPGEEVDHRLGHPSKLDTVHIDPMNPNQEIIFPRDFTNDWIEAKSKSKRTDDLGDAYYDDDDDDEEEDDERGDHAADETGEVEETSIRSDNQQSDQSAGDGEHREPLAEHHIEANLRPNANALEDMRNPGLGLEKIETFSPPEESDPNDSLVIKKEDFEDATPIVPRGSESLETMPDEDLVASPDNGVNPSVDPKLQEDLLKMTKVASDIFEELSNLKQKTFENIQKNFEVMLEALGESVLKAKIKKEPKAMESLIRRAISEGVKEDSYKVFIDPQGFELLKNQGSDLENYLQVDESLDFGSFRVESDLAKVAGGIKDIVGDFIEQNDIDIYSDEEN